MPLPAGVILDINAETITGKVDNDTITYTDILDQSGVGNHPNGLPASGTGAIYKGSNAPGSKPSIEFSAASVHGFTLPDFLLVLAEGEFFGFIKLAADPQPNPGGGPPIRTGSGGSADAWTWTDGVIYEGFLSGVRQTWGDPTFTMTAWHLVVLSAGANYRRIRIYDPSDRSLAWEMEDDGGANGFGPTATPTIGYDSRFAGSRFNGHIARMALFDHMLDETPSSDYDNALDTIFSQFEETVVPKSFADTLTVDVSESFSVAPKVSKSFADTLTVAVSEVLSKSVVTIPSLVELLPNTIIGSPDDGAGNTKANLFDNDQTTFFNSNSMFDSWVGLTADSPQRFVGVLFKTRPSDANGIYEERTRDVEIQISSDATFATDVTTVYNFPMLHPFYPRFWWHEIRWTASTPKTNIRWKGSDIVPNFCNLAELIFVVIEGDTTAARPMVPKLNKHGYRAESGSVELEMTCDTIGASIYWTDDGTDPDDTDNLYTSSFTYNWSGTKTIKMVSKKAGLDQPYSRVSVPAVFRDWDFGQNEDEYDIGSGNLLEMHCPGIHYFLGRLWAYASNANFSPDVGGDRNGRYGVWLYVSDDDGINWRFVRNILPSTTVEYDTLRPHVVFNEANEEYVLHAKLFGGSKNGAIATASEPDGDDWAWENETWDVEGYGMGDLELYKTPDKTKVILAESTNNVATIGRMRLHLLTDDYKDIVPGMSIDLCPGSYESPCMFVLDDILFAFIGLGNYYDSPGSTFGISYLYNKDPNDPLNPAKWSGPARLQFTDPVGTDRNGQPTAIVVVPGRGPILFGDFWIPPGGEYTSRYTRARLRRTSKLGFQDPEELTFNMSDVGADDVKVPANDGAVGLINAWPGDDVAGTIAVDIISGNNSTTDAGLLLSKGVTHGARGGITTSIPDHPNLQTNGHENDGWMFWTRTPSAWSGFPILISKDSGTDPNRDMGVIYNASLDETWFYHSPDGTVVSRVYAKWLTPLPNSTWVFGSVWHDADNDKLRIRMGLYDPDGDAVLPPAVEENYSLGGHASSAPVVFSGELWDTVLHYKGRVPSSALEELVYNGGLGVSVEDLFNVAKTYSDTLTISLSESFVVDTGDTSVLKSFSDTLTVSINEFVSASVVGDPLVDLFTGTAGTSIAAHESDSGHQWRIISTFNQLLLSGTGGIYSTHSGGASVIALSNRTPVSVNQYMEVKQTEPSHLNQGYALLLRATSPTNSHLDLTAYDAFRQEATLVIGKWVNGTYSVLTSSVAGPAFSDSDVTSFEVRGSGPVILDFKVNGITYLSYTDSSSPITVLGNPGIRYYSDEAGSPTTGYHVDSVLSGEIISQTFSDTLTVGISESYSVAVVGGTVSKTFSDTLTVGITDTYTVVHYVYKTFTDLITLSVTDTLNVGLATDLDYISVRAILGVGDITIQDVGRTSIQDAW